MDDFDSRRTFRLPALPKKLALGTLALLVAAGVAIERPLTAPLSPKVEIAELTWVEVRTAIEHGFTTVIVPSGGLEQNGPHMIIGKHDHIVQATARQIAEKLGRTLIAPVVSDVPRGQYDPPTGHMRFPGTIGVPEDVLRRHAGRHRSQPEGRRIQDHLLHRRPWRQRKAPGRCGEASQ